MTLRLTILSLLIGGLAWGQSVGELIQQSAPLQPIPTIQMVMLTTNVAPQCRVPVGQAKVIKIGYDRPAAVFWHRANDSTNWLQCTNTERVSITVVCTESNEQFAIGADTLMKYRLLTDTDQ